MNKHEDKEDFKVAGGSIFSFCHPFIEKSPGVPVDLKPILGLTNEDFFTNRALDVQGEVRMKVFNKEKTEWRWFAWPEQYLRDILAAVDKVRKDVKEKDDEEEEKPA